MARDPIACAVCGTRDARALTEAELPSRTRIVLCGTHEMMLRRAEVAPSTLAELRARFGERRALQRRASGEVDELAARLSDAFAPNRRVSERRAG